MSDLLEALRRLVVDIMLGNCDGHLKNWSFTYPDGRQARLSPAYDIVSTLTYLRDEADAAFRSRGYGVDVAVGDYRDESPPVPPFAAGEAVGCFNRNAAVTRSRGALAQVGPRGAVVFSRTGDPATGDFGDAKLIRKIRRCRASASDVS